MTGKQNGRARVGHKYRVNKHILGRNVSTEECCERKTCKRSGRFKPGADVCLMTACSLGSCRRTRILGESLRQRTGDCTEYKMSAY